MADDLTNENIGDILSILSNKSASLDKQQQTLDSIDRSLRQLLMNSRNISATNARTSGDDPSSFFRSRSSVRSSSGKLVSDIIRGVDSKRIADNLVEDTRRNVADKVDGVLTGFFDGVEAELGDALGTAKLKKRIADIFSDMAKQMGVDVGDIKKQLGRELGKRILNNSDVGAVVGWARSAMAQGIGRLSAEYNRGFRNAGGISRLDTDNLRSSGAAPRSSAMDYGKKPLPTPNDLRSTAEFKSPVDVRVVNVDEFFRQPFDVSPGYADSIRNEAEPPIGLETDPRFNRPDIPLYNGYSGNLANETLDNYTGKIPTGMETLEDAALNMETDLSSASGQAAKRFIDEINQGAAFDGLKGVGKLISGEISKIPILGNVQSFTGKLGSKLGDMAKRPYEKGKTDYLKALSGDGDLGKVGSFIKTLTGGSAEAGAALNGLTHAASTLGPEFFIVSVVVKTVAERLKKALVPAIEGTKQMFKSLQESANRYATSRDKALEESKKRLQADVETLIKTPFELLNKGAQAWYDAWDSNLRTINATQGYTKADTQNLLASFAERLRSEGLTGVISATDLTNNLSKVLESGLSGTVAEEFAYLATKLNAAIPTEDFFGYAGTYASIAANAIKNGKSQAEAIEYANAQIMQFASNILYASREVAGGFTTGLKDAEDLFAKSVKIAQTARTADASQISGVMSSVAAITGAIAPDLASGIVDAIYNAAVGGNSSELVALRSLAGINASNTEFLRELTSDPKKVFSELFKSLASMQSMSPDAYMEVAEGLSKIFGVPMDALARVDFSYLADAINTMAVNSRSLEENMTLLASGETTTGAEQLKMQQINKMILDEGLSYVLDNEAARVIQQHMWDEQLALQIQEATYAVNLQGSALSFLEGIARTVDNILNALNPFSWLKKIANLFSTAEDADNLHADIQQVLELGKVGSGNQSQLTNLLTRGTDLGLTRPLAELMGGAANYTGDHPITDFLNTIYNPFQSLLGTDSGGLRNPTNSLNPWEMEGSRAASVYRWGTVGKSTAARISQTAADAANYAVSAYADTVRTSSEISQDRLAADVHSMINGMSDFVNAEDTKNMSYDEWLSQSKKQYNIQDFNKALEHVGLTEEAVKGQYDALQTQMASKAKYDREKSEEQFWSDTVERLDYGNVTRDVMQDQNDIIIANIANTNVWMDKLYSKASDMYIKLVAFYDQWVDYFVKHSVYSSSYNHESVSAIQRAEKAGSEDAIYALADALTKNDVDLLDPTMQTNALLAEILKVANALLNKNGAATGGLTLPETIAGLSLGVVQRV